MKKANQLFPFFLGVVFLLSFQVTNAQVWKKIKNEVKTRAENNVVNKAGNVTDKAIDNTVDVSKENKTTSAPSDNDANDNAAKPEVKGQALSIATYKNYDFVPGDKIIFQPDLSSEPDAELPARFTVNIGNAEIHTYEGEKILHLNPD